MYKSEFMELIYSVISGSKEMFRNDKPAIRMLFSQMLDTYNKEGQITESQACRWILTARELNHCLSIANRGV